MGKGAFAPLSFLQLEIPMKTMKVKPWGKGQGEHVVINEADFDPEKHQKVTESKPAAKKAAAKTADKSE